MVGYPSGQRGQTVNLLAYAFDGSNPSPTTISNRDLTRPLLVGFPISFLEFNLRIISRGLRPPFGIDGPRVRGMLPGRQRPLGDGLRELVP